MFFETRQKSTQIMLETVENEWLLGRLVALSGFSTSDLPKVNPNFQILQIT